MTDHMHTVIAAGAALRERASVLVEEGAPGGAAQPQRPPGPEPGGGGSPPDRGRHGGRWGEALWERLPLWVRLRCGLEPRTLAALAVLLLAVSAFAAYHFWTGRPETVRAPLRETPAAAAAIPSVGAPAVASAARAQGGKGSTGPFVPAGGGTVVVDVAGKVWHPGIQRLPSGSRVTDALDAAGGARPGVDTTGLNRARVLMDGEQIVVGAPAGATAVNGPGIQGSPGGPPNPAGPGSGKPSLTGPVNLNSATLQQLDALPGVGPVLAQHIIDYRTEHGGFRSVDELRQVHGIGARRFGELRGLVQP